MPGTLNALGTMSGCSSPGGITRARTPTASATERSSGSSVGGGGSGGLRQSGSSSALSSLSSSNVDIGRTFEQGKQVQIKTMKFSTNQDIISYTMVISKIILTFYQDEIT